MPGPPKHPPPGPARSHDEVATLGRALAEPAMESALRRVVVIEGPDRGLTFTLDPSAPSRVLLGTGPACDLRLTDPMVSRRHAAFEPVGRRYRITDMGSTNGTFVDGVAIVEAFVRGGEVLRCGQTAMQLEADRAENVAPPPSAMRFGQVLGASPAMRRLYPLCERLAASRVPIVLEGEAGTGKELLAESLHQASGCSGPFVVFDASAVSPGSAEAELLGHEPSGRPGAFEEAAGGTLFIDEIGDVDLSLQAKLLRVIDRGELRRVGGQRSIPVDVRVITATRYDLDKAVLAARFRDDLLHRLAVARAELPPLREREGDVTLLARHFAAKMCAGALAGANDILSAELLARLNEQSWPGNVRELRNAVARHIALGEDEAARQEQPSSKLPRPRAEPPSDWLENIVDGQMPFPIARRRALEQFERRYVERVLQAHNGNVALAARASGLALRYFRVVKARRRAP